MRFKTKGVIIVSSLLLIGLFATIIIINTAIAPLTNKVVDERRSSPSSTIENEKRKQTNAEGKDANLKGTSLPNETDKAFTIVIDPGHQQYSNLYQEPIGPGSTETKSKVSSGTSGVVTKKPEYQLTLEAAIILKKLLKEQGFEVMLTREVNQVDISNKERADIANQHHADLFIRLHADGSTDRNVRGVQILTPSESHPKFEQSLQASKTIINAVHNDRTIQTNGVSIRSDLTGFNWSEVPVTLIEMGFMTNPEEDQNLSNKEYLRKLMTYIAEGIVAYRGQVRA